MAKKLTINAVAMGNLRHRKKQYITLVIGVILAMTFSCGVPFFLSCSNSSQQEIQHRQMGQQDVLILDAQDMDMNTIEDGGILEGTAGYLHILSYGWTEKQENGSTIAWMDDRARELYYPQIAEGRLPQQAGEIAIEHSTLLRMGFDSIKIGQTVSLHELPSNGSDYLSQQKDKTYTLVGILDNHKSYIEQLEGNIRYKAAKVPGVFVSSQELVELGGKENLIALLDVKDWNDATREFLQKNLDWEYRLDTHYMSLDGSLLSKVANSTKLVTVLALLLAFLSCFGIANAFASNLKERRKQIGLLRAVGATRKQIIQVFGREAVLITLICTPISVAVAYWGVKLFARMMGDYFVFLPSISILLAGAAFGFVVVILSTLIPLWVISRIPPMQAIRDAEIVRKMKRKNVLSQRAFQMDRLLAKRKMLFQQERQLAVSLLLAFTTVVLLVAVGEGINWKNSLNSLRDQVDYEVSANSRSLGKPEDSFQSISNFNDTITEAQRQEALLLPNVERVSGRKYTSINVLIEEEYPNYLLLNEFVAHRGASRFLGAASHYIDGEFPLNRDNFYEEMQKMPYPEYEKIRQWAGYEQELFAAPLITQTGDMLQQLQSHIIEGSIDLEKLDAGEEVILNAPRKIGFFFHGRRTGFSYGLMNLSGKGNKPLTPFEQGNMEYLLAEAESPFHVGDTLTLSMLVRGADGQPVRQDRTVRVGAIISDTVGSDIDIGAAFKIFTTVAGLDQFGQTFGYDVLNLNLNQDITSEIDWEMQRTLEKIFPGKQVESHFAQNEQHLASFKTRMAIACALILVLCTVSISLVNNSISAQIREGKRNIGTLRAVGASQRDIVRSYVWQILYITVLGVILGTVLYCSGNLTMYQTYGEIPETFVLWPAPILFVLIFGFCYFHLVSQLRKVNRQSIVENIREL